MNIHEYYTMKDNINNFTQGIDDELVLKYTKVIDELIIFLEEKGLTLEEGIKIMYITGDLLYGSAVFGEAFLED
jgi:hypothetical protein